MSDDYIKIAAEGIVTVPDSYIGTAQLANGSVTIAKRQEQYAAISTATTLGATQSVIDVTGTTTITLPTASSHTGRVYIIRNNGTATVTVSGITNLTLPAKGTVDVVSNGSSWSVLRGSYVDESVGRRVFEWNNSLATPNWQLVYGDTGWRNVASLATPPVGGILNVLQVRRITNSIHWRIQYGSSAAVVRNDDVIAAGGIPTGFTVTATDIDAYGVMDRSGFDTPKRIVVTTGGIFRVRHDSTIGNVARGTVSYLTSDSWPSTLPGVAVGGIP